jgi:glucosyl-dolichyl phosphate glucuronosyltransferase
MAVSISVVISTYTEERWDDLIRTISSLQRQSLPPREIIVVVDHNPTLLERARVQFPDIVVIENKEARGLSGSRNSGIEVAQGDLVAFLDDDAEAAPDWIEQLGMAYSDADVIGVGGAIEPIMAAGRPGWFPPEFDWVVGCTYSGMPRSVAPVRNLIGCNMSFRRNAFDVVGGFRNGVGQVGESMERCDETEFCIRLHQHLPLKVLLYKPQARVYHQVPASRTQWNYFRSRCFTEGIAKARLSQLLGSRDALSSEFTYSLFALPRGILRGLVDAVQHHDPSGLGRAIAITAGLGLTAAGYLEGTVLIALAYLNPFSRHLTPSRSN